MEHTSLPLYKTRKFWAFVFFIFGLFSSYLYYGLINDGFRTGYWFIFDIVFSFGGSLFMLLAPSATFGFILSALYILYLLYTLKKTFTEAEVQIIIPILFSLVYVTNMIFALLYAGGV